MGDSKTETETDAPVEIANEKDFIQEIQESQEIQEIIKEADAEGFATDAGVAPVFAKWDQQADGMG